MGFFGSTGQSDRTRASNQVHGGDTAGGNGKAKPHGRRRGSVILRSAAIFELQRFETRLFAGTLLSPGGEVDSPFGRRDDALASASAPAFSDRANHGGGTDPQAAAADFLRQMRAEVASTSVTSPRAGGGGSMPPDDGDDLSQPDAASFLEGDPALGNIGSGRADVAVSLGGGGFSLGGIDSLAAAPDATDVGQRA